MIISTVGSHSALQILYGAKQEQMKTRVYVIKGREFLYERYPVADEIVTFESYEEMLEKDDDDTILIPHGTIIDTLGEKVQDMKIPMLGNKKGMIWEMRREWNDKVVKEARIRTPKIYKPEEIDGLVIVKFPGAKGGQGYFLCSSEEDFKKKIEQKIKGEEITEKEAKNAIIQEYIVGVTMYPHYFYSPIYDRVEMLGIDRRYETNVDALGRLSQEKESYVKPSYTVVGNQPLIARESWVPKMLKYGDQLKAKSNELFPPGLIGPYCIELALTPTEMVAFEFTSRIVAGTSLYIQGSPYSQILFNEPMSMGKRIAREIKMAIAEKRIDELVV